MRVVGLAGLLLALAASAMAALALEGENVDWGDVGPVFHERCINCHGEFGAAKGLRLDSYEGALAGSLDGPVLLAGDAAGSELVKRIRGESMPRMPFLGPPLPQEELELIVRWVEAGMPEGVE